ncbi:GTPase IMAP family member 4-like [Engraulis encrasicolus]|uniref:GTPase IMAP family member 4-like n=1 Tax=Engraulis encrasicolus TaxID=184585 RepID=UPI002FD4B8B8
MTEIPRAWKVSPAVSELRLVLLGGSAAGKRAAGNTILGTEEFERQASTHTSNKSQHSASRQWDVAGRRVTVVDTPDWFCSGLSEKDMRQDVGLCVRLSAPGPHAFLLVVPVKPSEGDERRMLEKMENIFGEGCWRHTLILFTHSEGLGKRSVEELFRAGSQELQQLVEKCGNRCHLLNTRGKPLHKEITQLLEVIEEMVSGNSETFYSSETYQEAEKQAREIERRIQSEQKTGKRREGVGDCDRHVQESLEKLEGEIQQHEEEMRMLDELRWREMSKRGKTWRGN